MVRRCLDEGWACDKDPAAAVAWYRRAAEQGDAQAQCNLAVCLHDGSGVSKDRNEARLWFVRSAEQGNAYAQNKVGRYLDEG